MKKRNGQYGTHDHSHNHKNSNSCCGGCGCSDDSSLNNEEREMDRKGHTNDNSGEESCHGHCHHGSCREGGHGCDHEDDQFDELEMEEQIIQLKSDVRSLTDKLMRALAEIQNGKRIADKEKADALKYGVSKFAKDILVIRDTLKLALVNADESNPIVEGVKKVLDIFDKTIDNHGVKPVASEGVKFDPNLHQAIMEVESDLGAGMVVQVMQDGFMIDDRLLRPAMVTVSKGKN